MSKINLMIAYDPIYGEELAGALLEARTVDSCFLASGKKTDLSEQGRYHSFRWYDGYICQYEPECNLNTLPALSKELLEKMRPYESMAIKLGRRRDQFPVVEYETEKMRYHKSLRFWSYIFDKYNINCVYFNEFPHGPYEYVIYCLAKIKNIPMLCFSVTNIGGFKAYGDSMETVGENIRKYYQSIAGRLDLRECALEGPVADFYKRLNRDTAELNKERKEQNFARNELRSFTHNFFGKYLGMRGFMRPQKENVRLAAAAILKHHDWGHYRKYKENVNRIHMASYDIKYYLRNRAIRQKTYNRMAEYPDYDKKYIYFPLQYAPEQTTIPRAGVFSEQYTSVQLIARAAEKCGVMVYVKEHVVQPFRDKAVYQMLREIPNVRLIKTSVSTYDLMKNSISVASQTGTIILEAAIHGKPSLTTISDACCWKGLPSLFEIEDEETGAAVIQQILDGFSVSSEEVQRYFFAIQKCCIKSYTPPNNKSGAFLIDKNLYHESLDIAIKQVRKWLSEVFESPEKPA